MEEIMLLVSKICKGGRSLKRRYICIILIFAVLLSIHIKVYSKYVFEKTIDLVQFNVDRTKPKLKIVQSEKENVNEKMQNITLELEVSEKNLRDDIFSMDEIEIYVDDQQAYPSMIISDRKEDTQFFQIHINEIPKGERIEIKIKKGAITDIVGWENDEYVQVI